MAKAAEEVSVAIIGGGVCGVLAAQRCAQEKLSYKVFERCSDFGGNWFVRANSYSHLQARRDVTLDYKCIGHGNPYDLLLKSNLDPTLSQGSSAYAALYQWHPKYSLDKGPFAKIPGTKVLETLRKFAKDHGLEKHTHFHTEVTTIKRLSKDRFLVSFTDQKTGKASTITASSIFVASGILGQQQSPEDRLVPSLKNFSGKITYAGRHQGVECTLAVPSEAANKDVVILGTGAFALEAMEAAHRAGAKSITLLTRPRDRWIMPYSQQFKFVFLATNPFMPRWLACWLINNWMTSLYRKCGIGFMGPAKGSDYNFTGQCNDAFFQLALRGEVKYLVDKIKAANGKKLTLESGVLLPADIVVNAQGCEVMWQAPYLKELGLDFKRDLHNYAFLGKTARVGTASDWVWYNVPHGPQKQIESFFQGQRCIQAGKEQDFEAALQPTPFSGCKGESLVASNPSGLQARAESFGRSVSAGRSPLGKLATTINYKSQEIVTWLLCALMYGIEAVRLGDWLNHGPHTKSVASQNGKQ